MLKPTKRPAYQKAAVLLSAACLLLCLGCAGTQKRAIEVTAYCGCSQCCAWTRGSWKYLKLNFWNRYYDSGKIKGAAYRGFTASGTKPHQVHPGLFSLDSLRRPWTVPFRVAFFPWLLLPRAGTVAADTKHYPFGTRMHIPGYGTGVVEDRGSAIKGPGRIDIFFNSHREALKWGRQQLSIRVNP